jgi:hypothetical protein
MQHEQEHRGNKKQNAPIRITINQQYDTGDNDGFAAIFLGNWLET